MGEIQEDTSEVLTCYTQKCDVPVVVVVPSVSALVDGVDCFIAEVVGEVLAFPDIEGQEYQMIYQDPRTSRT